MNIAVTRGFVRLDPFGIGSMLAVAWLLSLQCSIRPPAEPPEATHRPLVRVVDLNVGESQVVELHDGSKATVQLLQIREMRDSLRQAVRQAEVQVEVNGQTATLVSANYNLPLTVAGVQIDCPVTKGYTARAYSGYLELSDNAWGLARDARLRLWPAGSPLIAAGTFVYPVRQRWFASATQMANEPTFVDGGEDPANKNIYYHYGLDFGGAEGLVEVVAATDGIVVSSGKAVLEGEHPPVRTRYDVVYILDRRGWYYRYSHLKQIDPGIVPGARVKVGQRLGLLGKEGGSGGWSHLHFDICAVQPSGQWGIHDAYAFAWEAYQRQYRPRLIAVARPHHVAWTGERVMLDGARSWSRSGSVARYEWLLSDGTTAAGAQVTRSYDRPGAYSEILKITDGEGRVDYDFAVVNVIDKDRPDELPPTIHACYYPTFGIKPGDEVTFKVRAFRTTHGQEVWDFGDGSPPVTVQSDGNVEVHNPQGYAVTIHRYDRAGHYIVTVRRSNEHGHQAVAHLSVRVSEGD